jgi:hypothetical protein
MKRPEKTNQNQSDVEVSLQNGSSIITKYSLHDLVRKIAPANRHGEIDLGPPIGRELLSLLTFLTAVTGPPDDPHAHLLNPARMRDHRLGAVTTGPDSGFEIFVPGRQDCS